MRVTTTHSNTMVQIQYWRQSFFSKPLLLKILFLWPAVTAEKSRVRSSHMDEIHKQSQGPLHSRTRSVLREEKEGFAVKNRSSHLKWSIWLISELGSLHRNKGFFLSEKVKVCFVELSSCPVRFCWEAPFSSFAWLCSTVRMVSQHSTGLPLPGLSPGCRGEGEGRTLPSSPWGGGGGGRRWRPGPRELWEWEAGG